MTMILVAGGGLAGLLLLIGVIVSITSERSLVEQRLGRYLEEETVVAQGEKSSPVGDWLNVQIERSNWGDNIARELARADLKLKAAEYIALIIIIGFVAAVVSYFIGGRSIIFALIGGVVATLLPRFYVRRQQSQRLIRFNEQLPDMLNLMVNGLRAGYSTMQALEAVSREMPSPISTEFRRVVQEMQLGIPMEDALENLIRRIPSDDLDLTIAAVNVQREVGGNLAEILDVISYTIRERVRIKGEIRVLTTQVMYSGRFLAIMPILIAVVLYLLNRPYMMMFFDPETSFIGIPALIFGALMVGAGAFTMNKIADIEV